MRGEKQDQGTLGFAEKHREDVIAAAERSKGLATPAHWSKRIVSALRSLGRPGGTVIQPGSAAMIPFLEVIDQWRQLMETRSLKAGGMVEEEVWTGETGGFPRIQRGPVPR